MPKIQKLQPKALAKLTRQPGLVLEGGKRTLEIYFYQEQAGKQVPVQPQLALWVDANQGLVRSMQMLNLADSPDQGLTETAQTLLQALTGPFISPQPDPRLKPGLPEKVRVDERALAQAIRPLLEPLGVVVEYTSSLPAFEQVFEALANTLGAEEGATPPQPFEWELSPARTKALVEAATSFIKQAPWEYLPDNPPLALQLGESGPAPQVTTLYASVLGMAGMVQGVALYYSLSDYYTMVETALEAEEAAEEAAEEEDELSLEEELRLLRQMGAPVEEIPEEELRELLTSLRYSEQLDDAKTLSLDCLTMWVDEPEEVDPTYLVWLRRQGIRYKKGQPVPAFSRVVGQEQRIRQPDERESLALQLALEGLTQFFREYGKQLQSGLYPPGGLSLTYQSKEGHSLQVSYPAPSYDKEKFAHLAQAEASSGRRFNLYQEVFDPATGEYREEVGQRYQEQLLELFYHSPEGQELIQELGEEEVGWSQMLLDYGMGYLGVTPPQMEPAQFRELLYEIIPRKVTVQPEEAPHIVAELRQLWKYLEREYQLPNAGGNLKLLSERAVGRLKEELSNPANFGPAKAFAMEGLARGYSLDSQASMDEWMQVYNAEQGLGQGRESSLLGAGFGFGGQASGSSGTSSRNSAAKARQKAKRKQARESRRKNRQ